MLIKKSAKNTLTAFELNHNDVFEFTLRNGRVVPITLLNTGGEIVDTDLKSFDQPVNAAKTVYRFFCEIRVCEKEYRLERINPTQESFYQPWLIEGVTIWFDAVSDIFQSDKGFLVEKDASIGIYCCPKKKARFAVQDASMEICPEKLHPWLPLPKGGLRIEDCYRGEDCWMGPYNGMEAHGGLDINHPVGLPLWAPMDLDTQGYFHSLKTGEINNRWRGVRNWDDGSIWIIQTHHMTELTVPENMPIKKGRQFAKGAGVLSGSADHSHFVFRVIEGGEEYFLDPWILFWKMYRDIE